MSEIEIKYCIDNLDSAPFKDEWDIEGRLSITKDSVTLTKRIDDSDDDGFRGDYIFYNLERWVDSVPKICNGERCKLYFIDSQEIFMFIPKGEITCFKYYTEGIGQLVERENKRYPNHEEGIPLKTDELVLEIIRVSELFIDSVGPKIKDKSDIIRFKQSLKEAREAYDQYLKRTEQN
ncbi:hypothetical protein [Methanolobus psychrotolerans]|uniref:hypothetical protein n=1 Tax=Methanolobus psychrotolerans TaxID=1874706 RepID=UPI000B9157B6|nr:hypothetical protein [Methanolobus psychrotolerans]